MPKQKIPQHIAIIMDGNGRWARQKGLPRIEGHRRGAESLKETIKGCIELGIKYLTVYAFSTENWKRPKAEVNFLMKLIAVTIENELEGLKKNSIRIRFLGRTGMLTPAIQAKINNAEQRTKNCTALNLNIMISYGARAEITDALLSIISENPPHEKVDEELISRHLYTAGIPDPDLMIRTAGEMRLSNFMLWQLAYTELYFTDTLWPDFGKKHLLKAIRSYNKRVRKFGGI